MAKTTYGASELSQSSRSRRITLLMLAVAELVLLSVGTLFLVEPLVALWQKHIETAVAKHERPPWVSKAATYVKASRKRSYTHRSVSCVSLCLLLSERLSGDQCRSLVHSTTLAKYPPSRLSGKHPLSSR